MSTLSDFAKNLVGRSLCGRAPALPTAVYCAMGTGGTARTSA